MKPSQLVGATLVTALLTALASAAPVIALEVYKLPRPTISETLAIHPKSITVLNSEMSYLEIGSGAPVLFVHGNASYSYLWRNVLPYVADKHRAIAVDLIGMGNSGKPALDYTFANHLRYLEAFVDAMGLKSFAIVSHDWGAALAWEYARRHPDKVLQIAFMEGVLPPEFPVATFESMGRVSGEKFRALRDKEKGSKMVIENNMFVDEVLPRLVVRPLGKEARAAYSAPYLVPATRLPTLMWARELPIEGQPATNVHLMENIRTFMQQTKIPALLMYAEPGAVTSPEAIDWFTSHIQGLETAFLGQGLHFIQEDQPEAMGRALKDWLRRNESKH